MTLRKLLLVLQNQSVDTPWYLLGGVALANAVAVYKPIGAADYAASKVNLANPGTNNAIDGAAYPTWDAVNGWTFVTASSQYLNTGITPATNTYSIVVRYVTSGASTHICSCYTGASRNIQITRDGFNYPNNQVSGLNSGVKALTPTEGYHDGVARSLSFTGWSSTNTRSLYIGARNLGTVDGFYNGTIQAVAIYNTALTPAQVLAISTAMAALT